MLLRRQGNGIFAVTQPAHAWVAGTLAQAWGNARFAPPAPRQPVCLATALHDIGWLDWERVPEYDAETGWPRVFADVPAEIHTVLWRRGVEHVRAYSLYGAILVSMHGDTIYDKTFDPETARPAAAEAVTRLRADGKRFREAATALVAQDPALAGFATPAQFAVGKAFLAALDTVSLNLCWGIADMVTIEDVPETLERACAMILRREDSERVSLDPWPFDVEALTVALEGRSLAAPVASQAALDAALAAAVPEVITVTLTPRLERRMG